MAIAWPSSLGHEVASGYFSSVHVGALRCGDVGICSCYLPYQGKSVEQFRESLCELQKIRNDLIKAGAKHICGGGDLNIPLPSDIPNLTGPYSCGAWLTGKEKKKKQDLLIDIMIKFRSQLGSTFSGNEDYNL